MYLLDNDIKNKIDEFLEFRNDCADLYKKVSDNGLKEDYVRMYNLITCKFNDFIDCLDSILYPPFE